MGQRIQHGFPKQKPTVSLSIYDQLARDVKFAIKNFGMNLSFYTRIIYEFTVLALRTGDKEAVSALIKHCKDYIETHHDKKRIW